MLTFCWVLHLTQRPDHVFIYPNESSVHSGIDLQLHWGDTVNAAFDALPAGTVESLLEPENKPQLETILQHHVMTSALAADFFQDGQTMGMVDGTNVTFSVNGDEVIVDGAKIIGSVKASNGWVHVVDKVILPK